MFFKIFITHTLRELCYFQVSNLTIKKAHKQAEKLRHNSTSLTRFASKLKSLSTKLRCDCHIITYDPIYSLIG